MIDDNELGDGAALPAASAAELPAGRELDALVAERVMGWEIARNETSAILNGCCVDPSRSGPYVILRRDYHEWGHNVHDVPPFSRNIGAAWQVVEKMREWGLQVVVECQPYQDWPNEMEPSTPSDVWRCAHGLSGTDMCWRNAKAETAPLAICRAALRAVGKSTPEAEPTAPLPEPSHTSNPLAPQ